MPPSTASQGWLGAKKLAFAFQVLTAEVRLATWYDPTSVP